VPLTDDRLSIRPPVEDDAPVVAAAVRSSLAELAPWMPWATPTYDESDALAWMRRELGTGEHPFVMIAPDGEIVGSCGINRPDELNRFANLGYWVRADRVGRGYATSATRLLAAWGFRELGLARIEIVMSVENEPSRRVAERVGATHEGVMRRRLLLHGRHHDAHLFSLVPSDPL
jgi:RimJ/RimL family protein N-acetyltransferase